jgi:hypothetical protein
MNKVAKLFVCSTAGLASIAFLVGAVARAEDGLVGTWKLLSFVREESAIGKMTKVPLAHMKGEIVFAPDGRYLVAIVAEQCTAPAEDENRGALHEGMIVHSGRYRVSGDKLIQQIDLASNKASIGVTQKQFIGWAGDQGDQLVLESMQTRIGVEGKTESSTITLERQR